MKCCRLGFQIGYIGASGRQGRQKVLLYVDCYARLDVVQRVTRLVFVDDHFGEIENRTRKDEVA